MITLIVDTRRISIPNGIKNLSSFRKWALSDDFDRAGQICFLNGEVWVDMTCCSGDRDSELQVNRHDQTRRNCNSFLAGLKPGEPFDYYVGGIYLANKKLGFCVVPDGMMASMDTIRQGIVHNKGKHYLEFEFTPDMVLEVVSASSLEKDTVILRDLYWQAGIREYWLVDVHKERQSFDILRHTSRGYAPVRKQAGWLNSAVFGESFRLVRQHDERGHPEYTLRMR